MGDYFRHWLETGPRLTKPPLIFHVNWFRKNAAGKFLWPGFGDNMRVLEWIVGRCSGSEGAIETPIGLLPQAPPVLPTPHFRAAADLVVVEDQRWERTARAELVAAARVCLVPVGSHEDDRRVLRSRPLADEQRGLEAVHDRHVDVEQDDRELHLQDVAQRLLPGPRADDVLVQLVEDGAKDDVLFLKA